ncbi:hypothetical protein [Pallidibacillus pasinlerensis]|uniref:DUF5082 domain-containing protein n=1 Tax=Pallidibacillus pasinlerensis TaxID=2703818 RepID=A0ABX0A3K1_9BACI|nr:hypothetical protein [Pallidibacillus pasinlerensis]NCU18016.1 hypothetical protein [Pallidibacillus pasinlerensis]
MSLKYYLVQLEKERERFHNSLFEPDNRCSVKDDKEIYGRNVSLSLETIESINSIAHDLQDSVMKVHNESARSDNERIGNLCEDIIDLTTHDSNVYKLAKFDFDRESTEIDDDFIHIEDTDSLLEYNREKALEKHEDLIDRAKEDVYKLEDKMKQLISLLRAV